MNLRCYTVVAGEPDVAFLAFTPPRPYKDHKNILFLLFWALGSTRNERERGTGNYIMIGLYWKGATRGREY